LYRLTSIAVPVSVALALLRLPVFVALAQAAAATALAFPAVPALAATDAVTSAVADAINAMFGADPSPERMNLITVRSYERINVVTLPDSWKAKRAAMAVLGVSVVVYQQESEMPRWVAEMHLPDGASVSGSWPDCVPTNMFTTSR
jgi:hypothetical protein